MLTLKNADAALKEYYLDAVSAQLNQGVSPFFNEIEKTSQYVYGKSAKCVVCNGKMGRIIACDESDDLPTAQSNTYTEINMALKNIYGCLTISDKAIRASQDSSGALVNLLDAEMEGLIADAKANFSRMMYGDGNGTIAVIKSINGTKVYLDSVKQWFNGLTLDVVQGTTIIASGFIVKTVNVDEKYVEFKQNIASFNLTSGNKVTLHGTYGKEINGLAALFEKADLYGADKADDPYFKPYSATVETLTADDIIEAISAIEDRGGGKVKMILCSHSGRKKIADLFSGTQKVVANNDVNLGYSGVYVNEIPVYADRFCPDDRIYLVNPDDFVLCQLCDWSWLEDERGKVLRPEPYKAAYTAAIVKYAELICKKPCGQGLITI